MNNFGGRYALNPIIQRICAIINRGGHMSAIALFDGAMITFLEGVGRFCFIDCATVSATPYCDMKEKGRIYAQGVRVNGDIQGDRTLPGVAG